MTHEAKAPVEYRLCLTGGETPLNPWLGQPLGMKFLGVIHCIACGRETKKSYSQGYCFPCARDLPENAMCAVRPETCAHDQGGPADLEFYRTHCNIEHIVYLSLTSGVKVGVTRHYNVPDRWIDQGAVQALVIARLPRRVLAGQMEVAVARHMADKTNWRKMLKGEVEPVDLLELREQIAAWVPKELCQYLVKDEAAEAFTYPVLAVPEKITSHNLDKTPEFSDRLTGIKGQYLLFDKRVINLRKYAGYEVEFSLG